MSPPPPAHTPNLPSNPPPLRRNQIHVATLDGEYHTSLEGGDLYKPTSVAIRPGAYAPLSSFSASFGETFEVTAGEKFELALDLRDGSNDHYSPSQSAADNIKITIEGVVALPNLGDTAVVSIGDIVFNTKSSELKASGTLYNAGTWTVDTFEQVGDPDVFLTHHSLAGCPFKLVVVPAASFPDNSFITELATTVRAGENVTGTLETVDKFMNPTASTTETFGYWFDEEYDKKKIFVRSPHNTFVNFAATLTKAKTYDLHVSVENKGVEKEVKDSPYTVAVQHAALPDASTTVSSLNMEIEATIQSLGQVKINPVDEFGNAWSGPLEFFLTFTMEGGEQIGDIVKFQGPQFLLSPEDVPDLDPGAFEISIRMGSNDGPHIKGSPYSLTITDAPSPTPGWKDTYTYIAVVGVLVAVIVIFAVKTMLNKDKTIDVMTKGKEMAAITMSMGMNIFDPMTDFSSWYIGIRKCGSKRSSGYFLLVVVAFVLSMMTVRVCINQLNYLSSSKEEEGFGDAELDAKFAELKEKYKSLGAGLKQLGSRLGMGKVAPAKDDKGEDTPQQQKEKELLAKLVKIKVMKVDISQRARKEERAVASVLQLYFEDIPFTVMNLLFVVYGCGQGEGSPGVQFAFLSSTVISCVFGAKKYFEWKQVQADRRNVAAWVEVVEIKLAESKKLLRDIKIKRCGGETVSKGEFEEMKREIRGAEAA